MARFAEQGDQVVLERCVGGTTLGEQRLGLGRNDLLIFDWGFYSTAFSRIINLLRPRHRSLTPHHLLSLLFQLWTTSSTTMLSFSTTPIKLLTKTARTIYERELAKPDAPFCSLEQRLLPPSPSSSSTPRAWRRPFRTTHVCIHVSYANNQYY